MTRKIFVLAIVLLAFCGQAERRISLPTKPPANAARKPPIPRVGSSVPETTSDQCASGFGPFLVGGRLPPPIVIRRDDAPIREAARRDGLHGMMILEIIVAQDGQVGSVHALRAPKSLEFVAEKTVMQWHFTRPMCAGKNVAAIMTVTIEY